MTGYKPKGPAIGAGPRNRKDHIMNEIKTMVPATGCLEASWVSVRPDGTGTDLTVHFAVFGLYADLTLVIAMHSLPATSAYLDSWLIGDGDRGQIYPDNYGPGELWHWLPACECRGKTVKHEPGADVDDARYSWAEWKAVYEKTQRDAASAQDG